MLVHWVIFLVHIFLFTIIYLLLILVIFKILLIRLFIYGFHHGSLHRVALHHWIPINVVRSLWNARHHLSASYYLILEPFRSQSLMSGSRVWPLFSLLDLWWFLDSWEVTFGCFRSKTSSGFFATSNCSVLTYGPIIVVVSSKSATSLYGSNFGKSAAWSTSSALIGTYTMQKVWVLAISVTIGPNHLFEVLLLVVRMLPSLIVVTRFGFLKLIK